jgi:peptide/nickel transport system substrate-binding protein
MGPRRPPDVRQEPDLLAQGQPYLDKVVVKIMPDSAARVLALRAGEVDFIDEYYFPLSAHAQFANDKNFVLQDISYPSDDLAIINTRSRRSTTRRCARRS